MDTLFTLLHAAWGLLIVCTPFMLWPVCAKAAADGGHMNCWYMGVLVVSIGAAVCILALAYLLTRNIWIQIFEWLFSAGISFLLRMVSSGAVHIAGDGWAVGLCAMENMSCRAVMMPHVTWITIGLCLTSALWAICLLVMGRR